MIAERFVTAWGPRQPLGPSDRLWLPNGFLHSLAQFVLETLHCHRRRVLLHFEQRVFQRDPHLTIFCADRDGLVALLFEHCGHHLSNVHIFL